MKKIFHVAKWKYNLTCNVFLYFSAITANLATYSLGVAYAWSSPAIPRLNGQLDPENNPLPNSITPYEESWIASLVALGAASSTFIYGYLSDKIGRKYTLLISSIPTLAGFALLTFGNAVFYFYIGRFLCGFGCGAVYIILPIYIGEVAESTNRGALGCFLISFMTIGNLVVYVITPYVTLQVLSSTGLVAPVMFLMIFGIFAPESPYHYVAKKEINFAEDSLLKLRYNNKEIVKEELSIIIKSVEESFAKKITIKDLYYDKAIVRGFSIAIGLVCFQQFSGVNVIFFYMQSIFEEVNSGISTDNYVIVAGVVQFLASACTLPAVDRFGRRILLLTSTIGTALTLFVGGIYFYLKENTTIQVDDVNWLPILTINLYIMFYVFGFGAVTFTMIGELFPPHVKSMATTVCIFACLCFTFFITNIFPYFKDWLGMGLSFCLLGCICCIAGVFIYTKVPETKAKSLQEIQELLLQR